MTPTKARCYDILIELSISLDDLNELRKEVIGASGRRALSIAATELETAMLWLADAVEEV